MVEEEVKLIHKDIIPAQIRRIDLPKGSRTTLVFSLNDFIDNPSVLNSKKEIISEFENLIEKIESILGNEPSSVPRKMIWKVGKMILDFRKRILKKYNIYITNLTEAFANNLNLSDTFVGYMIKFSEFSLKRQVDESISWSTYMEALNLPTKKEFYRCIQLIKEGKLRTSKEVREYVKERNKKLKTKN